MLSGLLLFFLAGNKGDVSPFFQGYYLKFKKKGSCWSQRDGGHKYQILKLIAKQALPSFACTDYAVTWTSAFLCVFALI